MKKSALALNCDRLSLFADSVHNALVVKEHQNRTGISLAATKLDYQ